MSVQMVLAPVFALVLLIFILLFAMGRARNKAVSTKEVRISEIALGQNAWPDKVTLVGNSFSNMFEMPVLFFVLIALALPLRQADLVMVLLSWVYVALRYMHAGVHVTSNQIGYRFWFFTASCLVLMAMWIYFALKLFLAL